MPLAEALFRHAQTQPEATAFRLGAQRCRYGDLWQGICARHGALAALPARRHAISPGQPLVALLLGNHELMPQWLALGLAAPVTLALLDPAWPAPLRARILARLAPDLVITPQNASFGLEGPALPPPLPAREAPLFIGFTSGTTADPKAFLRTRASWRMSLGESAEVFGLSRHSHTLAPGPLHHGLTFYALAETLHAGACFTGMTKFSASEALEELADAEIQRLVAVPTMLEGLSRAARNAPLPTRQITTAGAALSPALLARLPQTFPQARITEYYGASELGFVSLAHHVPRGDGTLESTARGVGQPYPGIEIEIRNNGARVAPGEIGTVFVSSPHPVSGYLWADGPHAFTHAGGWASVGDLGALDDAGNLTLMGRADGMVITGGYNVYPQEVAAVLARAPGVVEAEVLAVPDDYLGQRLVGLIRTEGAVGDLAAFCAEHLPRYKVPRAFFTLTQWPLTASGKIARATLLQWIETNDERLGPLA